MTRVPSSTKLYLVVTKDLNYEPCTMFGDAYDSALSPDILGLFSSRQRAISSIHRLGYERDIVDIEVLEINKPTLTAELSSKTPEEATEYLKQLEHNNEGERIQRLWDGEIKEWEKEEADWGGIPREFRE